MSKLGLIAGNGRFPFLLLDAARAHNLTVVVAAINEETDPEINARAAADPDIRVHWLSLGELSRLIETFQAEGVTRAVMAGQVKHKQIFSSIRPDWRLAKLLLNLRTPSSPPPRPGRPASSPPRPASPSKPWKAPTPLSPAPANSSAPSTSQAQP